MNVSGAPSKRPTRDIDLLGRLPNLVSVFLNACGQVDVATLRPSKCRCLLQSDCRIWTIYPDSAKNCSPKPDGYSTMSQLLDQAVAEARKLTDREQDAIAALILEEIEDDRQWEKSFARSPGKLIDLAARAAEQVREGHCEKTGFDGL